MLPPPKFCPVPEVGFFDGGGTKSGGSAIFPPISKEYRSPAPAYFRLNFLTQKNTMTPIIKAAEMPDATDTPITAGMLKEECDSVGEADAEG